MTVIVGCASKPELTQWTSDVLVAERKLQHREYAAALSDFEHLEASALFRSDAVEMRMRQAEVHRRAARYDEAIQIMSDLERKRRWVDREQLAKIVYLKGRMIDDSGKHAHAEKLLFRVLNAFPKTAFGWRAWVFLKPRFEERLNEDEFIELCRGLFKRHRKTPIADNFIYAAAHRYFTRGTSEGNARALKLYEQFLQIWIFETSGFWDDVVWELSLVYHRLGRYDDEERLLEKLLSTRQPGWPSPSDLKSYKYAYMRIAKLYMFELKRPGKAADLFRGYEEAFPDSIFRDDMLWWEGHAWLLAGDRVKAEQSWQRLATLYPESKYIRRVKNGHPAPTVETPIP
jgi:tetratricopeptide (TPR) repeat protein